ncbi:MAG TPA: RNA 2',3'-cyclic phosphodiesterase [Armatimonadota bacterium]|jgi:2'-5' RNA ligase
MDSPTAIRSFIALELNEPVRIHSASLQDKLRRAVTSVKWVDPLQLHLTLKFLGDVSTERIPEVSNALEQVVAERAPFDVTFRGAGAFPNARRPRVLWVGAHQGAEELCRLAAAVETAMERLGFPKEDKLFRPHLTLGRFREGAHPPSLESLLDSLAEEECGVSHAEHLTLFASRLTPKGPVYTVQSKHMYGSVL